MMNTARRASIDCSDIIGRRWSEETGCADVVAEFLQAKLGFVLEPGAMPLRDCDIERVLGDAGTYRSPWTHLGREATLAAHLGDVFFQIGPRGAHVSVLCDNIQRLALTSNEKRGAHVLPVANLHGVVGVYRLRATP